MPDWDRSITSLKPICLPARFNGGLTMAASTAPARSAAKRSLWPPPWRMITSLSGLRPYFSTATLTAVAADDDFLAAQLLGRVNFRTRENAEWKRIDHAGNEIEIGAAQVRRQSRDAVFAGKLNIAGEQRLEPHRAAGKRNQFDIHAVFL